MATDFSFGLTITVSDAGVQVDTACLNEQDANDGVSKEDMLKGIMGQYLIHKAAELVSQETRDMDEAKLLAFVKGKLREGKSE